MTKVFIDGDELAAHLSARRAVGKKFFNFSFHFPDAGGAVRIVRFPLQPDKCGGATWREKTQGWGLIDIQVTDQPEGMSKCCVSVNSDKRANAWAETYRDLGDPQLWNWKVVERQARRLVRVLRRLSS